MSNKTDVMTIPEVFNLLTLDGVLESNTIITDVDGNELNLNELIESARTAIENI